MKKIKSQLKKIWEKFEKKSVLMSKVCCLPGISFSADWQIHRKFALKTFKMLGVGRNIMEEKIHEEARRLVGLIAGTAGRPFCNKNLLRVAMSNVICAVIFGKSFHGDTAEVAGFYDQMNAVFRYFGVAGVLNLFPRLIVVPAVRESFRKVTDALNNAAGYITLMFEQHMATYDSGVIRDYTDAFIEARLKEKAAHGEAKLFTGENLFWRPDHWTLTLIDWLLDFMTKTNQRGQLNKKE